LETTVIEICIHLKISYENQMIYKSIFSTAASSASVASSASDESNTSDFASPSRRHSSDNCDDKYPPQSSSSSFATDFSQASVTSAHFLSIAGTTTGPGLSRQQLLSGLEIIYNY
jgi:hypothetical protein